MLTNATITYIGPTPADGPNASIRCALLNDNRNIRQPGEMHLQGQQAEPNVGTCYIAKSELTKSPGKPTYTDLVTIQPDGEETITFAILSMKEQGYNHPLAHMTIEFKDVPDPDAEPAATTGAQVVEALNRIADELAPPT